ncbi:aminoglycoside phosphotransferase family protein [Streptomyces triticirhizae]|uniref:Aminoglycoside phosphotransferase family protein n=1 Tax=Streptomyces triticirhizae TaxID=2483353 RepID=A0A3M2M6H2_9ACTN|nr:aminoglycoside phosphotransferase family protein [Streptomyces triticirhizae]RMI45404.1 aminoglycoside phosphotransferase family protein [Streptomyces triticirhizae]
MVENTAGQHAAAADDFLYLAGTSTTGPSPRNEPGSPAEIAVEVGTLSAGRTDQGGERFGPFGPATVKPFSITRPAVDQSALLKIYRGVEPLARRDREADALRMARLSGVSTPSVLATGEHVDHAWSVLSFVPGTPCSIATASGVDDFVRRALSVIAQVHSHGRWLGLTPGSGWRQESDGGSTVTHREFLSGQLSPRCRRQPWWQEFHAMLAALDPEPTVYLQGDIKPEHLLIDGARVHVVDWEASARGPAVCDYADMLFHLVRDVVYAGAPRQRLPLDALSQVPAFGPVVAWRLALWLDRRRPDDLHSLTPHDIHRLSRTSTPADAARELGALIAEFRSNGVPR